MKKVLIISTSLRKGSNSEYLAKEVMRGAKDSGNDVEFISLMNKEINYCKGCLACQKTHECVIKDDAIEIAKKVKNSDVIVYAMPVYYYGMSGLMKTLIDRMNSLYDSDYLFRDIYVVATAADDDESAMDGTLTGVQGWLDCYPKTHLAGVIRGVGLNDANEAEHSERGCKKTVKKNPRFTDEMNLGLLFKQKLKNAEKSEYLCKTNLTGRYFADLMWKTFSFLSSCYT